MFRSRGSLTAVLQWPCTSFLDNAGKTEMTPLCRYGGCQPDLGPPAGTGAGPLSRTAYVTGVHGGMAPPVAPARGNARVRCTESATSGRATARRALPDGRNMVSPPGTGRGSYRTGATTVHRYAPYIGPRAGAGQSVVRGLSRPTVRATVAVRRCCTARALSPHWFEQRRALPHAAVEGTRVGRVAGGRGRVPSSMSGWAGLAPLAVSDHMTQQERNEGDEEHQPYKADPQRAGCTGGRPPGPDDAQHHPAGAFSEGSSLVLRHAPLPSLAE